jgi:hypothetical protein
VLAVVRRARMAVGVRVGARLIRRMGEDHPAGIVHGAGLARPPVILEMVVEGWRDEPCEIQHQEQRCFASHPGRPAGPKSSITHATHPARDPRESRLAGPGVSSADPWRTRRLHIMNVGVPQTAVPSSGSALGAPSDPRISTPFGGSPPGRRRRAQAPSSRATASGLGDAWTAPEPTRGGCPGLPGGTLSFSLMRGAHPTD